MNATPDVLIWQRLQHYYHDHREYCLHDGDDDGDGDDGDGNGVGDGDGGDGPCNETLG